MIGFFFFVGFGPWKPNKTDGVCLTELPAFNLPRTSKQTGLYTLADERLKMIVRLFWYSYWFKRESIDSEVGQKIKNFQQYSSQYSSKSEKTTYPSSSLTETNIKFAVSKETEFIKYQGFKKSNRYLISIHLLFLFLFLHVRNVRKLNRASLLFNLHMFQCVIKFVGKGIFDSVLLSK